MDNRHKYEGFREKYPEFVYEGYDISESGGALDIAFSFEIPGLARFRPTWSITALESPLPPAARQSLDALVFSLGMAELISYWKICCPPKVLVKAGELSPQQIVWWKKLYAGGLGEYFYRNNIAPGGDFIDIVCAADTPATAPTSATAPASVPANANAPTNAATLALTPAPESTPAPAPTSAPTTASTSAPTPASAPAPAPESVPTPTIAPSHAPAPPVPAGAAGAGGLPKVLIPIGGGKDSAVTLELLRGAADRYGYIINPRRATEGTALIGGVSGGKLITAKRTLDKNMLMLNERGYLNGHTPFSAIVAFSSLLAACLNGLDYIALSNESSANETTVAGSDVNHQYSKGFVFEMDFRQYARDYLHAAAEYFSLLRPLSELQIARLFAGYKQYHAVFKSCNAASKADEWCGVCPKCLFVYIILSPFLCEADLVAIYNKNLFEDMSLKETLDKLTGAAPEKPFECVGSRSEARFALELTVSRYAASSAPLPPLLRYYIETRANMQPAAEDMLTAFDTGNAVPAEFLSLINAAAKVGSD